MSGHTMIGCLASSRDDMGRTWRWRFNMVGSRPDIVLWDTVAIEVKGPTGSGELNTIASKVIRYKQYFDRIVCVLFDVEDEVHYAEWLKGMTREHPEVIIMRK